MNVNANLLHALKELEAYTYNILTGPVAQKAGVVWDKDPREQNRLLIQANKAIDAAEVESL